MKDNIKGFTLIEMIIAITIIGILAGAFFPSLMAIKNHNMEREREGHEIMVNKTLKQYYALTGQYPALTTTAGDYSDTTPYQITLTGLNKLSSELVKVTGVLPDVETYDYFYMATDRSSLHLKLK